MWEEIALPTAKGVRKFVNRKFVTGSHAAPVSPPTVEYMYSQKVKPCSEPYAGMRNQEGTRDWSGQRYLGAPVPYIDDAKRAMRGQT